MAIKLYQRPVFCKWLNYITLIYNHKIYNHKRAHILETIKIKYLIYPQVRYSKQAKKKCFLQVLVIIQRGTLELPTVART